MSDNRPARGRRDSDGRSSRGRRDSDDRTTRGKRDQSPRRGEGGPSKGGQSRGASRKPQRDSAQRGSAQRQSWQRRDSRDRFEEQPRTETQKTYDGPPIPEEVTGSELDRSVIASLKSLPEKLATRVARHLVAAGLLLESDPRTAYEHTLAARARASRLAVVREAVGEAAYAAGEYAEALAELRAARRMNGAWDYVAMMADCERALGRPDRALTLIKGAPVERFSPALLAEVRIVEAGARRDRGEIDAALRTLEGAGLMSRSREPWLARLRYAYADALLEASRPEEALTWFHRTEAVDGHEVTDAATRAAEVEASIQANP